LSTQALLLDRSNFGAGNQSGDARRRCARWNPDPDAGIEDQRRRCLSEPLGRGCSKRNRLESDAERLRGGASVEKQRSIFLDNEGELSSESAVRRLADGYAPNEPPTWTGQGQGVYRTANRLQSVRITAPATQPDPRSAMQPELILIAAQQHLADLYRAASHYRLVHTATSSHAASAPRHAAVIAVSCLRWLRQHGRLEPREDQAGDCR
jgi:hypothetical protein